MSVFLQLFGAGGVIAILVAVISFFTYLSNHSKNKQDGYSKVFQDQDKNMASTQKRLDDSELKNKELRLERKSIEKKFNALLIFCKNIISTDEDRDLISTQEAHERRMRVQEIEFSE